MRMKTPRFSVVRISLCLLVILIILAWVTIAASERDNLLAVFNEQNKDFLIDFVHKLIGVDHDAPAYLQQDRWITALKLSWDTFVMALLATGMSALGMLIFVFPTARNVASGQLTLKTSWLTKLLHHLGRIIFLVGRAVPELMWAMILVYIFKPGLLPGALALALHNFGILGKLVAEVIEDMDPRPVHTLALNGASQGQLVLYAIVPDIMPKVINYILYRLENIIRATLIVGLVGAGGLGLEFRLAMSFFKYTDIALYLMCYILLVYVTDVLSTLAKNFIRSSSHT